MPLGATSDDERVARAPLGSTKKRPVKSSFRGEAFHAHCPTHRAPRRSGAGDVALDMEQLHAQTLRHAEDPVVAIELAVDDAPDAGVRDLLEAVPAWAG